MNNPFKILGVTCNADKKEILQKAMEVLPQNRSYDAHTIAEAQKTLFSPLDRAEAEFMYCLDMNRMTEKQPDPPGENEEPELNLLEVFNAKASS